MTFLISEMLRLRMLCFLTHTAPKFASLALALHLYFFQNLCPGGSGEPTGDLAAAITRDFGSLQAMKDKLSASTVAVQVTFSFSSSSYDNILVIINCQHQL